MDMVTLMMARLVASSVPGSAGAAATQAAAAAQAAAEAAEAHNYGITVSGGRLVITAPQS